MSAFSEWLQFELDKRGWNQGDLMRASGLRRSVISNLINERRNPGKITCQAIAHGLNLPKDTVYRAAGLLDEITAQDKVIEIIVYRMKYLTDRQLDEVMRYSDFIRERDSK